MMKNQTIMHVSWRLKMHFTLYFLSVTFQKGPSGRHYVFYLSLTISVYSDCSTYKLTDSLF